MFVSNRTTYIDCVVQVLARSLSTNIPPGVFQNMAPRKNNHWMSRRYGRVSISRAGRISTTSESTWEGCGRMNPKPPGLPNPREGSPFGFEDISDLVPPSTYRERKSSVY